jgi:eukaryotic-like serine/threonine-protein kinase
MTNYQPGDTLLNKYRLEALIGRGAFAEVYRVTHLTLNVTRAVKVFSRETPGVGSTEFNEFLGRFQLEAQLGAELNTPVPHPNLVQVYDFQSEGELLLLEMEYAAGGSLAECIARARKEAELFPIDDVLQISMEIARGLAAIHDQDTVHRDLKPSNILFDRDGHAKIADLGLAQIPGGPSMRSRLSEPVPHPGTPGYMSPEQQNQRDYLSPRSDVYTFGLILFEMLTGRFYHNVRPGTRVRQLRAETPEWLDDLVTRLLAVEPGERPWNGEEVLELLESEGQPVLLDEGEIPQAPQEPPAFPEDAPTKPGFVVPKPVLWAGGCLLMAIPVVILGIWLWRALAVQGQQTPLPVAGLGTETPAPADVEPTQAISQPTNTVAQNPASTATEIPTKTPGSGFQAGDTRVSSTDGMVMLYVPEGSFMMGNNSGDANEFPVHQVHLDAYWIDQTEVTNSMYEQCVRDGFCNLPATTSSYTRASYYGNPAYGDYPVMHISWADASAYCSWAGRRLPSEAEWEKAARSEDGRLYPWGNSSPSANLLNWNGSIGDTSKAGSYPAGASPYGALDMAGNLWEWVADWYSDSYYASSPASNPPGPRTGTARVLRGGSCLGRDYFARTTNRWFNTFQTGNKFGFRCAVDATP